MGYEPVDAEAIERMELPGTYTMKDGSQVVVTDLREALVKRGVPEQYIPACLEVLGETLHEGDTYEIVGDDGKPVAIQQVLTPWPCCGSTTDEHKPDCPDRCRHCGSEGSDLDHKEGCPTIGTCAVMSPNEIDLADAHPEPESIEGSWVDWYRDHMREFHPGVRYWR
jgi:hypothetical protein